MMMISTRQANYRAATGVRRAFTLIELLVVISIIGLLMSILLPSLKKARDQGKTTVCKANLKSIHLSQTLFMEVTDRFQTLNNDPNDGNWQYNYLIWDGRDRLSNFGPLVNNKLLHDVKLVYCPFQKDSFHARDTSDNPWPPNDGFDSRASYARRHLLTGWPLSHFRRNIAFYSDVMHLPKVIRSAHKKGVNATFLDGHVSWIPDPGIFTNNGLGEPFDVYDNPIVEKIWLAMDRHQ
jgi:prepilin-type N-terminal cleavage/methylation domain-containing protein/prepilin-type processing-associated H-X9-DG protein